MNSQIPCTGCGWRPDDMGPCGCCGCDDNTCGWPECSGPPVTVQQADDEAFYDDDGEYWAFP